MEGNSQRTAFLMETYKSRIQFFSDHANRTWTRFNILLTVELALSGLSFNIWFERGASAASLWLLPAFGVVVSIIWYVLGVQDRCAYLGYREQIAEIEKMVTEEVGAKDLPPFNPLGTKAKKYNVLNWRWGPISLSKLLALFPLFFLLAWAVVLFLALR